jgi:hypothetical protein
MPIVLQQIFKTTIKTKIMKRNLLFAAALVLSLFANNVFAQKSSGFTDVSGTNFLNAGIGLGSYGLSGTGGLPLTASFEHGFSKNISAGVEAGLIQRKFAIDWKYTYLVFGARGSYHLNEALKIASPQLDVYGGAGLFYRHFKVKYNDHTEDEFDFKSSGGDVVFELHAGARYMFSEKVGAYAELGYGISPLKLGVSLKF